MQQPAIIMSEQIKVCTKDNLQSQRNIRMPRERGNGFNRTHGDRIIKIKNNNSYVFYRMTEIIGKNTSNSCRLNRLSLNANSIWIVDRVMYVYSKLLSQWQRACQFNLGPKQISFSARRGLSREPMLNGSTFNFEHLYHVSNVKTFRISR